MVALVATICLFSVSLAFAGTFLAFGPEDFIRGTGKPVTVTRNFSISNPDAMYTLAIHNGGASGNFDRVSSAVITVNGIEVVGPSEFSRNVERIEKSIALAADNVLTVEVRSKPGSGFTLEILGEDNDPPTITAAVDPAPNAAGWNSTSVTVTFDCVDPTSGIASCPDPIVVDSEGADQVVSGTAIDLAGNANTVSVTLNIDKTPPELAITFPEDGATLDSTPVTVTGDVTDALSGVASLVCNGVPASLLDSNFTCDVALLEGGNPIRAEAVDVAGNEISAEIGVFLQIAVPEPIVSITAPIDRLVTRESEIQVMGTVADGVTSAEVNGVPATLGGGSFSATVPLREGTNMVVALATRADGTTGTDSVEVTRDIFAPTVRIQSPREGFVSFNNVITIAGQVNDIVNGGARPMVRVNGLEATVADGSFMVTELPLVRGPNLIEAVATDAVGNEGRHAVTVFLQTVVGPRISIAAGNGQAGTVNRTLPQPLVVEIKDDFGNPLAGRVVTFRVTRNSGTLRSTESDSPRRVVQVPTDGSGQAQALFTLGDTAGEGNNRIVVTALGVAGEVEFCSAALPSAPDKILMVSGDNQRGVVGHPLATPLEALVVDKDGNPIPDLPVVFTVARGSGNLDGESSLVRMTSVDGIARAVLTLGTDPGINNNLVSVSFDGLLGLPATFVASGLLPGDPGETRFRGVVLDNGQTPIPGALVSIEGTSISAITDDEGQFLLENVPVGHIVLAIDPSGTPRPETFPPLAFEVVTVAGQTNILGQPILIPALDTDESKIVGGDQDVTLIMTGVAGLELTVFANSVTCPDLSTECQVTISQVHLDKVPMPPPSGTIFMPPAWTIQPAGVAFDPPARITIPNDGLPPGRVIDIFQFDHALNEFIDIGKGTVSEDGLIITSDPGFGITRAGWGGCGQPQPPTTTARKGCAGAPDDAECISDNPCKTNGRCQNGICEAEFKMQVSSPGDPTLIPIWMIMLDRCKDSETFANVCNDPFISEVEVVLGRSQPQVVVDEFFDNRVDIDDLEFLNANRCVPWGADQCQLIIHLLRERINRAKTGVEDFPPSHAVAIEEEENYRREVGFTGPDIVGPVPSFPDDRFQSLVLDEQGNPTGDLLLVTHYDDNNDDMPDRTETYRFDAAGTFTDVFCVPEQQ